MEVEKMVASVKLCCSFDLWQITPTTNLSAPPPSNPIIQNPSDCQEVAFGNYYAQT